MALLEHLPPEEYRRRHEALLAAGRARLQSIPAMPPPGPIDPGAVVVSEIIDGGWYWTTRVDAGMGLRLHADPDTRGVAMVMWSADEPTERLNLADTVKVQLTTRLRAGQVLLSDMGRVLASITADSGAGHDLLLGGPHDETGTSRNNRDNFFLAAARFGLGPRDIPPWITFFADVRVDEHGRFKWLGHPAEGGTVDLRAEMDLLVAISNAPHGMSLPGEPSPVDVVVWRAAQPAPNDPSRNNGPEITRAFANTERPLRP